MAKSRLAPNPSNIQARAAQAEEGNDPQADHYAEGGPSLQDMIPPDVLPKQKREGTPQADHYAEGRSSLQEMIPPDVLPKQRRVGTPQADQ